MHINSIESIRFRAAELPGGRARHFTKRVCLGVCTQYFFRTDAAILCYQPEQWLHNVNGLFPYASLLILSSFAACTYSPGFLYWAAYSRLLGYPSCVVFWKAEPFTRTTGRHLRVGVPSDCCANLFSYILFVRFWFLSNSRNVQLLA